MPQHEKRHGEVEAPKHLHDANPAVVAAEEEEREVAEARHPHVARDHHAHGVVPGDDAVTSIVRMDGWKNKGTCY